MFQTNIKKNATRPCGYFADFLRRMSRWHLPVLFSALFVAGMVEISAARFSERTSVGGYGELHFNYTRPSSGTASAPVLDFHRWILFLNHRWTEQWSFASELELEHNFVEGGEKTGEMELEQAYIQFQPVPEFALQTGVLLTEIGLLNNKHEPVRFLSVERPAYAKVIIPTTWFGNGMAGRGLVAGAVAYSAVVLEGLDDRKFMAEGIRGGRQKGFKSSLETVLLNPAVNFVAVPGLTIGTSSAINLLVHDPSNSHPYSSTVLWELHAQFKKAGLWTQAEFGTISYTKNKNSPRADTSAVLAASMGWYADAGYDIARFWNAGTLQLYPYVRYTQYNAADKIGTKGTTSAFLSGLAVFPIEKVSLKIDYARESKKDKAGSVWKISAGAGYVF